MNNTLLDELIKTIESRLEQLWEQLPCADTDPIKWTIDECMAVGAFKELESLQDLYEKHNKEVNK